MCGEAFDDGSFTEFLRDLDLSGVISQEEAQEQAQVLLNSMSRWQSDWALDSVLAERLARGHDGSR